ncbi:MAG: hypothetical protein PHY08_06685 [Candidatus Cloacimonetes bacterium]|jgi:hypothetical protein|nr:hypothetical protein [Candidatus Cloacimonadota bacterium]MDD4156243.1 hypothetical protein [Candidatus Cloacimonadota bacterium]
MKVTFFRNIKTLSGKCNLGQMVFGAFKNATICIARNYVYPKLTEQNEIQAEKMRAAVNVWSILSENFVKDLTDYAHLYNFQHHEPDKLNLSAYNIFLKVVLGLQTPIASKEQLSSTLGDSVNDWISASHLPSVATNKSFNNVM